jgi:hypothetical protein
VIPSECDQRIERAMSLYHGEAADYNCAQAVLATFADCAEGVDQAAIDSMSVCGGGNAEAGLCGALYAAHRLLDETGRELLQPFVDTYGSTICETLLPKDCCRELVAAVVRLLTAIAEIHPLRFQA